MSSENVRTYEISFCSYPLFTGWQFLDYQCIVSLVLMVIDKKEKKSYFRAHRCWCIQGQKLKKSGNITNIHLFWGPCKSARGHLFVLISPLCKNLFIFLIFTLLIALSVRNSWNIPNIGPKFSCIFQEEPVSLLTCFVFLFQCQL